MQRGTTFAADGYLTNTLLHNLVDAGTLTPSDIMAFPVKTATADDDKVLLVDSADGWTLKHGVLSTLLPAESVTPGKLDPTLEYVGAAWRSVDSSFGWRLGAAGADGWYLQQTDLAVPPVALFTPLRVFPSAGDNVLAVKDSKVGINTITPASALDVVGSTRCTDYALITGEWPLVKLTDTTTGDEAEASVGLSEGNWVFGRHATGGAFPEASVVAFSVNAANGSLWLTDATDGSRLGVGTVAPAQKLHVDGNIKLEGQLFLGDAYTPSSNSDGTAGQMAWDVGYLYLCYSTGTGAGDRWGRVALTKGTW